MQTPSWLALPADHEIVETGRGDRVFLIRDKSWPASYYTLADGVQVTGWEDSLRYGRKAFERVCQDLEVA